jgi:Sec-independent protein translocase protein TatA
MEHFLSPFLSPWHLLVFAIVGFLVFAAMGMPPSGSGPTRRGGRRD